jgi:ABC-type Mn2+/Zn2+ transport system permease subunit
MRIHFLWAAMYFALAAGLWAYAEHFETTPSDFVAGLIAGVCVALGVYLIAVER